MEKYLLIFENGSTLFLDDNVSDSIADDILEVFRFTGRIFEKLQSNGDWVPVESAT